MTSFSSNRLDAIHTAKPQGVTLENLAPSRAAAVILGGISAFAAGLLVPSISRSEHLTGAFVITVAVLLAWLVVFWVRARHSAGSYGLDVVLRTPHYVQACAQGSVLLYWGWYWPPVYEQAGLIAAQIVFAYAFDMLLTWSRRPVYTIGFGPFPIVFSINLFLWFKPEVYLLQFAMIAIGLVAKDRLTWQKAGRRTHIFNPSSFPLALFSLGLILTATTDRTLGQEIATTFEIPPHIAAWIFVIGLPGQLLFGVASMTMSAVVTLFTFSYVYFAVTGTYFFVDAFIPVAVFLGMHLLFTDPSTSPRTEIGRLIFGVLYALAVAVIYALFERAGAPTFYDKLLPVPVLNLTIKALDRLASSGPLRSLHAAIATRSTTRTPRKLAYVVVWAIAFAVISAADGVGDLPRGRLIPVWQAACHEANDRACRVFARLLTHGCIDGSPWACNELGIITAERRASSPLESGASFRRACDAGLAAACRNAGLYAASEGAWIRVPPSLADYVILLQEEVRHEESGAEVFADHLRERACADGWLSACHDKSKGSDNGSEDLKNPFPG